jgi:DNA uptake protein ComE-like DNA-binding protein
MKRIFFATIALLGLVGCNQANPSPETIRHDTARATNEAVTDAKAVAKGVVDGLKQQKGPKGAVDINRASADDLETLPGIDAVLARKIVDGRPYQDPSDLRKRHIVTTAEYERISGQVVTQ